MLVERHRVEFGSVLSVRSVTSDISVQWSPRWPFLFERESVQQMSGCPL